MSKLTKIEDADGFFRNQSGVVVNINKEDVALTQQRRQKRKDQEAEHVHMVETVKSLEEEMSEIKSLLSQLVEKL
jgi:hypothetical protein